MLNEIGPYHVDWIQVAPFVEDLEPLPGTQWLVAAAMSNPMTGEHGRLYLVDTSTGCASEAWPRNGSSCPSGRFSISAPLEPEQFAPHGIAIGTDACGDGSWNLYVVHHGARESIEIFRIVQKDRAPVITWIGAVARRPGAEGNAVALLPGGGLIASYCTPRLNFRPELHDGRINGGVERWSLEEDWTAIPLLQAAFPNGVAVSDDGATYFLADTRGGLNRVTAQNSELVQVPLAFRPDNLKWGDDGRLLTTGIRTPRPDAVFAAAMADPPEPLTVVVAAVDATTLEVETLLEEHISFGLPTTAVVVRNDLYLTSLFGKQVARLRRSS